MDIQLMFIVSLINRYLVDLGFYNLSRLGDGGIWIDPNNDMDNFVWCIPWFEDSMADLVSFDNPSEVITKLDLDMTALVVYESMVPVVQVFLSSQAPTTRTNNTPTAA